MKTVILLHCAMTFPDWITAAAAPNGQWVVPFRALKLAKIKLSSSSDKSNSWIQSTFLIQHLLTEYLQGEFFCLRIWVFFVAVFLFYLSVSTHDLVIFFFPA